MHTETARSRSYDVGPARNDRKRQLLDWPVPVGDPERSFDDKDRAISVYTQGIARIGGGCWNFHDEHITGSRPDPVPPAAMAAPPATSAPPTMTTATFGSVQCSVDRSAADAAGIGGRFTAGISTIYAHSTHANLEPGAPRGFVWRHGGAALVDRQGGPGWNAAPAGAVRAPYADGRSLPPVRYEFVRYLNEEPVRRASCTVG